MHLEGTFETPVARPLVWEFLLNPNEIAPCFPDLQSLEVQSPESFKMKVKVGLSVVKGTMDFEFHMKDKVPISSAKLVGAGKGIGSSIEMQTAFNLQDAGTGTKVGWVADAKIGGVMAGLGTKLLDASSSKIVSQALENIQSRLRAKTAK
jgi:carbon monoxide dehydrogenase subunit G